MLFGFGSQQDFKDATKVIAGVDQGGLGLPDRDYYLKDEARFADVRKQYVPHVAQMFELAGDGREAALEAARQRPRDRDRARPRVAGARASAAIPRTSTT